MRFFVLWILVIIQLPVFSQITFDSGYYIGLDNQKINCLIKNYDWKDNPTEIVVKLRADESPTKLTNGEVLEFGIGDHIRFISRTVKIDRSSDELSELSIVARPEYSEERLFLKVVIDGAASNFYRFQEITQVWYFFDNPESQQIEQFIHKLMHVDLGKVKEINTYRQQIKTYLSCNENLSQRSMNLPFTEPSLKKYIVDYNECMDAKWVDLTKRKSRQLPKIKINFRGGMSYSFMDVKSHQDKEFNGGYSWEPRFGFETEVFLNFNRDKWSLLLVAEYHRYQAEYFQKIQPGDFRIIEQFNVDYSSSELGFGVRHSFYFAKKGRFFVSYRLIKYGGTFLEPFVVNETVNYDIRPGLTQALELGVFVTDRISIAANLFGNVSLTSKFDVYTSNYRPISFNLCYTLNK